MASAGEFLVEDVQLIFRNFAGKETTFNKGGERNFCVPLNPDQAAELEGRGWNVRVLQPREEGDDPTFYIQVKVSFKVRPPRIVVITSTGRKYVGEDGLEMLDYLEFETVDVLMNGSTWEVGDKGGIKAYLKALYLTLKEDALQKKYGIEGSELETS